MTDSSTTSLSLIQRARSLEDPAAWERLSLLYVPLVYKWACSANLQHSDASDVVQDVFQAVSRNIGNFEHNDGASAFRGWLYGITRNKIKAYFRRQSKQPEATGGTEAQVRLVELPVEEPVADSVPNLFHDKDSISYRALKLIKTDFKESTWQAFWRVAIDEESPSDVAADLGISVGSVYTAKSRVLSHLRKELDGLV